ncbi:NosR/NirI family protein [Pseudohongiella sp.]|uniref:4Fe-4S ferredoxin-type domain-containing protein n=1 Tax=marine sediment metagenome TaxID=412755 RepID=A0A0F9W4Z0_9ZZZZ|nr:4Fe-4S binding protein [Pseudohongiella sp.]HDZ07457.1 4Fe-4S binding protein [Pseudohongiella sp.]HEA63696.1 4Fe-4S binding protein [Pseudohongiella sp.]
MFANRLSAFVMALAMMLTCTVVQAQPPRQPVEGNPVRTPFSTNVQPEWLQQVMPAADSFSDKQGEPPVYEAFRDTNNGGRELIGYVFLTADVPPQERGFSAPIPMLVGVDLNNQLTGMKILDYVESYSSTLGDFLADPVFQGQFVGKPIADDFRINSDIDGITGATVSSFAITRGIREAARRVAGAYNGFTPGSALERARSERILQEMQQSGWDELVEQGIIKQISMNLPAGETLTLTFTYMGHPALGEYFIGRTAYARAERDASARLGGDQMILMSVGGDGYQQFRQDRLQLQQGDLPMRRLTANLLVTAGNADEGLIAGRAEFAGAIVLDDRYDLSQPINIYYQPLGSLDPYELQYEILGLGQRLASGDPILSEAEIERIIRAENSVIRQFLNDPPWGVTPWGEVAMLLLIFTLVLTAFFRKSTRWRWAALTLVMVYLGFMKAGFLSVAHITGALVQGPGFLLNNLPLLMIVVFTVVTTLIWGRLFCSSLCPFGAVQDIISRFTPKRWLLKVPQKWHDLGIYTKYAFLAFIIGAALIANNVAVFQYFEPFGTLFFLSGSAVLFAILGAILLACVVVPRFYCRYLCPLGAALGVVSFISPRRIKRVPQCQVCTVCEHACPTGAIRRESIDFKECVRCDICERKLINKAGSCRHDMSKIIVRHKELAPGR